MSGHSKWSQIKFKKAVTDAKKSKLWSKIAAQIAIAAREKGGDLAANAALKTVIEKAKSVNMPNDNIERAIKRGAGELGGEKLEEMLYEAYGPGGTAILISAITDNKNRTLAEVRHILNEHGGKLAESGSVKWMFKQNYELRITNYEKNKKEEIELAVIEEGAEDVQEKDEFIVIYTSAENAEKIKTRLLRLNLAVEGPELDYLPQNPIVPDEESRKKLEALFEALDEQSEVEEIYSNIRI
ncbi:MAG: YebC/PmpR family DNA-binding transcriptional regulator [bacterium]|nr:YebC/PmpR family DNA-binding transcriptional regulator [bacterium]